MFAYALQTVLIPLASVTQHCDVKILFFHSILLALLYLPNAAVDVWNVVVWLTFFAAARRGFVVSTHKEQIERSFETLRHVYELYI